MTYGNEQSGLEDRDALRGFSDEFVDLVVSGPQVRRSFCHFASQVNRRSMQDRGKSITAPACSLGPFSTHVFLLRVDHQSSVRISKSI